MTILFLGNSHVSAFKLALKDDGYLLNKKSLTYCARGADLGFTTLKGGRITACSKAINLSTKALNFFCPDNPHLNLIDKYLESGVPIVDIEKQFSLTGGQPTIELSEIEAIFYVAGVSPFDFVRLECGSIKPYSSSISRLLVKSLLCDDFLLKNLLQSIRKEFSNCKHYFIGMPLMARKVPLKYTSLLKEIVFENRAILDTVVNESNFDAIYMPSEKLLDGSFLCSKFEFTRAGKLESQVFQGVIETQSDLIHMNKDYGRIVIEEFVNPLLA